MQSLCPRQLDETAAEPKSKRRESKMNQPGTPTSAANAADVHLSKVKLAALVTAVCATALAAVTLAGRSTAAVARTTQAKPTVVLVNGAWANNASWSRVIKRLHNDGITAIAPPNPLQSLNGDAQTIADFLQTIPGPIVLVGHSYGGMVISSAATGNPNV